MAHIQRAIANSHRPNGPLNGEPDAPPSTMAAQLINNISTRSKPSRPAERDDLQRLMIEISEMESQAAGSGVLEVKIQYAHKLIYVFTLTVLERLAQDDPFMNVPQMASQAADALDIFMTTIKDTPGVLEYVLSEEEVLQGRGHEPLWAWLFPKVLVLLGRKDCDALTEKIKDFFFVCFQAVARSPKLWILSNVFFAYLKECVSVLLESLQNCGIVSSSMDDVSMPSADFDFTHFLREEDPHINLAYRIQQPMAGLWHVVSILSVIGDISTEAVNSYDTTSPFQDFLAWILDSILSVHELQKRWRETAQHQQYGSQVEETCFCTVQALVVSLKSFALPCILHKSYVLLAIICADILQRPTEFSGDSFQVTLCSSLLSLASACREDISVRRLVRLHLENQVTKAIMSESASQGFGEDFKKAAVACCEGCGLEVPDTIVRDVSESFQSATLDTEFREMKIAAEKESQEDVDPPSKRRKVTHQTSSADMLVSDLYSVLAQQQATDLYGLHQIAEECFTVLNESDRERVFTLLSFIPCVAAGTLQYQASEGNYRQKSACTICENIGVVDSNAETDGQSGALLTEAVMVFEKLAQSTHFVGARRVRIAAMLALRRFVCHTTATPLLDLEKSFLGQWCMGALNSSLRELRIAASRTLALFLREGATSDEMMEKNKKKVVMFLREITEKGAVHLQETCIMTWGQLGRVFNDTSLALVLLELVKYLSHSNPIVSGVAFNEILGLARARNESVNRLFEPFWDVIAFQAVKDLLTKPQTTQYMADILNISVPGFLILTQLYSLPYLVLSKNYDVIKRISQARQDEEPWFVCFERPNLVKILALLLQQSNAVDIETYVTSLLIGFDPKFKENDFTELVKIEPSNTAFHLLLAAGQADEKSKARVKILFALEIVASRASILEDNQRKPRNEIGYFLEEHMLGLVHRFIDSITTTRVDIPMIEKERNVRGIEELVKVAKAHSRVARPHLCSCLQSALAAHKRLQLAAFSAWNAMLRNFEDDDVEVMLESTFAIIIQHWTGFGAKTKQLARDALEYLLEQRLRLIRISIVNLPTLSQLEGLEDMESRLQKLRTSTDTSNALHIFSRRLGNDNSGVVYQALAELREYLSVHQGFLQASAVSEQPDTVVALLVRSILDTCVKFNRSHPNIAKLSAECIGLVGCLDPNRVETVRKQREMIVVTNFHEAEESTDFVLFTLQEILVPAFHSTTDISAQGFFSFSMQRLLEVVDLRRVCVPIIRSGSRNSTDPLYLKWLSLPPGIQDFLTPFLSSRYFLQSLDIPQSNYPIFDAITAPNQQNESTNRLYGSWLRRFVSDLLSRSSTLQAGVIFPALSRAIRIRDTSVTDFLLPYLVVHVVLEGSSQNRQDILRELLSVLTYQMPESSKALRREEWRACLGSVFRVMDCLSRWVQERQLKNNQHRGTGNWVAEIDLIHSITEAIPAEVISQRAIECQSYSRALFYWEQHIRNEREKGVEEEQDRENLQRLQEIYVQIDEPDGIEGISAQLHVLDIEQQIIGHQKAGRWTAAQTWYEIRLAEKPDNVDLQVSLLNCLKESGQHDVLLNYVEGMKPSTSTVARLLPFATEASWVTGRWEVLERYLSIAPKESADDFNMRIGQSLLSLYKSNGKTDEFVSIIDSIRKNIASSLSEPMTASLAACHDTMLKLHILTELEMIAGSNRDESNFSYQDNENNSNAVVIESLSRRIEVIGAFLNDKQYLLGIRRAAMQLSCRGFTGADIAEAWLTSARLARKGNATHQSFNAVLHASRLGDKSATIEHARLIWKEGNHRKAIGILEGAIKSNAFISHNRSFQNTTSVTEVDQTREQNLLEARAHLMLAKWQDAAGQTNTASLRLQYQHAASTGKNWEKGHYYLGRHYNKLLESQKALPADRQDERYLTGETARLVIENYLRSLSYGTKYIYQTLPRVLTLWLDLGSQMSQAFDVKSGNSKEFVTRINSCRKQNLDNLHSRFVKYTSKLPAYMFYTALPQILSRISHPNADVFKQLHNMIVKVVSAYPQHALWNLLAASTSNQPERQNRGMAVLASLQKRIDRKTEGELDIRTLIKQGNRLTEQLLAACNTGDFPSNRNTRAHLVRDLHFNQKVCTPSSMVVPFERVLTATLPTLTDNLKGHKAFSSEIITIDSFDDEVLILSSLQKPRKLTAIGSDGRHYGLLCKPKDDLRKDQRLMEFNSMINRALKRDAEASRRQLYIKTYAVTPLNEECGLIEWVDGLKTFRDILLGLYKAVGISPNYKDIEYNCEQALQTGKEEWFTKNVLDSYPPVFHKWFVQQFPEPSAWFAARIRYTRSCAVMSMVGTILGLGDRHGENILYEEGNGGTFHVDFNCLFDKGLTFTKPEKVPFRLTHNMIDAMGMYNFEGPFRKSSELTLKLLRQHEETLMTILEAFVYDPTLDLLNKKPEKKRKEGVPQTAQGVLESIQRKVKGYLAGETVPLGVEGQVEELIKAATNQMFLAGMYIGWCSFL